MQNLCWVTLGSIITVNCLIMKEFFSLCVRCLFGVKSAMIVVRSLVVIGSLFASAIGVPVSAQQSPKIVRPTHIERVSPPPRMDLLVQLSEILGEAHSIRSRCNGDGDQTWRNYMQEMMAIEVELGARRSMLTGAFNRGYRAQARENSACTADVAKTEAALAAMGREIAEEIARSYLE